MSNRLNKTIYTLKIYLLSVIYVYVLFFGLLAISSTKFDLNSESLWTL
jgi:hypothetical protein